MFRKARSFSIVYWSLLTEVAKIGYQTLVMLTKVLRLYIFTPLYLSMLCILFMQVQSNYICEKCRYLLILIGKNATASVFI